MCVFFTEGFSINYKENIDKKIHLIALLLWCQTKCKGVYQVPLEAEVEEGQNIHRDQWETGEFELNIIHFFPILYVRLPLGNGAREQPLLGFFMIKV